MRDLTIPYDSPYYINYVPSSGINLAYRKNNQEELRDGVCIDVLPGFDTLPKLQQDQAISLAFTNISDHIENDPALSSSPSTAMVCISYVKQIDGQTKVYLTTASAAGCNIYYVIKDRMDKIKKYQRLNDIVYKDVSSGSQEIANNKYTHIDVPQLINSLKSVQIEHFEIPLADDEELFLIAAKGIRPICLAQSGNKQGDDAKNVSITYRFNRGCDAAFHFIERQSTANNAIAITRTMNSSGSDLIPAVMGVFSGYNGSLSSELLVQQLSDEIFSNSLKCLDPQLQLQLRESRSEKKGGIKNWLRCENKVDVRNKGLPDIFALINSRASKVTGLQEVSAYFRNKFTINDAQSVDYLQNQFSSLTATIQTVFVHQDVLDIHKYNILDKYVLFIDKSNSWQQLVKELRDLAFSWLTKIAEKCETNEAAEEFLNGYRNHPVFSVHRANHWFQKIGRTQTVIEIDKLVENYKTCPRLVTI